MGASLQLRPSLDMLSWLHSRHGTPNRAGEISLKADGRPVGWLHVTALSRASVQIDSIRLVTGMAGHGYGTRLLREITEAADAFGADLHLQAFHDPRFDDGGWLVRFYRRAGFEIAEGPDWDGYVDMTRLSRVPARAAAAKDAPADLTHIRKGDHIMLPDIESAKIITLSTAHLHPATIEIIEREHGDLPEGPSIALREEGYLLNTYLGVENALERQCSRGLYPALIDRAPDLVLLSALGRGAGAAWINIDRDAEPLTEILPSYDDRGALTMPTDPAWAEALSAKEDATVAGVRVVPSRAALEMIEAGQTPRINFEDDCPSP